MSVPNQQGHNWGGWFGNMNQLFDQGQGAQQQGASPLGIMGNAAGGYGSMIGGVGNDLAAAGNNAAQTSNAYNIGMQPLDMLQMKLKAMFGGDTPNGTGPFSTGFAPQFKHEAGALMPLIQALSGMFGRGAGGGMHGFQNASGDQWGSLQPMMPKQSPPMQFHSQIA